MPIRASFGNYIAQLRNKQNLSRPRVIAQLIDQSEETGLDHATVSEPWLKRIENDEVVKLNRTTILALCRALKCSPQQQARALLLADRNILSTDDVVQSPAVDVLNYIVYELRQNAIEILDNLLLGQPVSKLSDTDCQELGITALELAVKQWRAQRE